MTHVDPFKLHKHDSDPLRFPPVFVSGALVQLLHDLLTIGHRGRAQDAAQHVAALAPGTVQVQDLADQKLHLFPARKGAQVRRNKEHRCWTPRALVRHEDLQDALHNKHND